MDPHYTRQISVLDFLLWGYAMSKGLQRWSLGHLAAKRRHHRLHVCRSRDHVHSRNVQLQGAGGGAHPTPRWSYRKYAVGIVSFSGGVNYSSIKTSLCSLSFDTIPSDISIIIFLQQMLIVGHMAANHPRVSIDIGYWDKYLA